MTVRRKKPTGEEITLTFSKKNLTIMALAALFLLSGNPILQKAGSHLLGIASPVSNIEDIKAASGKNAEQIDALSKQISKTDHKLDTLIVEVEQLRLQQSRTADN
jgi:hypothetical protein